MQRKRCTTENENCFKPSDSTAGRGIIEERARQHNRIQKVLEGDIERLDSIPGIATRMAEQILAEIGTNIKKQFLSPPHLCSWAALVPGHNESAGKRKSSKTKKGNKYLKSALTEAAHYDTFVVGRDSDWTGINNNWRPIGGDFPVG